MRRRIIIKGDFQLEGDIPALNLTPGRFKFVELELEYNPVVRMVQFTAQTKTTKNKPKAK